MKKKMQCFQMTLASLLFLLTSMAYAKIPVWTFIPLTPTTLTVPVNGILDVQYTVQNQSRKPKTLVLKPTQGLRQTTTCVLAPKGQPGDTCTLVIQVTGSQLPPHGIHGGPIMCLANADGSHNPNQCYQPSAPDILNITPTGSALATIEVQPIVLHLQPDGPQESLFVTNTSTQGVSARDVQAALPASWTDVVQEASDCQIIAPGAGCQLRFTPGSNTHVVELIPIQGSNTTVGSAFISVSDTTTAHLVTSAPLVVLAQQELFTEASGAGGQSACETIWIVPPSGAPYCESRARTVEVRNIGPANTANNVSVAAPSLPAGTTVCTDLDPMGCSQSCGDLEKDNDVCVITITPGATPTSPPDQTPVPDTITVTGDNTGAGATTDIIVLSYGNRYQEGFVFAIDDSEPAHLSVAGTVAALQDESGRQVFGPSPDVTNAISPTDGRSNTGIIANHAGDNLDAYAAGSCLNRSAGNFRQWYMPANCELSYIRFAQPNNPCGSESAPTVQNIFSNLISNGNIGGFSQNVEYWSSTEFLSNQANAAWITIFSDPVQFGGIKDNLLSLRCVRPLQQPLD